MTQLLLGVICGCIVGAAVVLYVVAELFDEDLQMDKTDRVRLTMAILMSSQSRRARLAEQQRLQDNATVTLMVLCSTIIAAQVVWALLN